MNDNRINELIENAEKGYEPSKKEVDDFIQKNLTPSQANAIQNVLKDPQLIRDILNDPRAKQILERLGKKKEG